MYLLCSSSCPLVRFISHVTYTSKLATMATGSERLKRWFQFFALLIFHLYVVTTMLHLHIISQCIRYSRYCGSYNDFHDRGLQQTRKLLNQGFLVVKLKSLLRTFYGGHYDLATRYGISVSQMTMYMFRLSLSESDPFLIHCLSLRMQPD